MLTYISTRIPAANHFTLIQYSDPLSLQERYPELSNDLVTSTLKMRSQSGLPFWDCLLANINQGDIDTLRVLCEAVYHNDTPVRELAVDVLDLNETLLAKLRRQSPHDTIAVSSKIDINQDEVAHIPLLDFHIPCTPQNLDIVCEAMSAIIGAEVIILESGKSYHAYAVALLSELEWRQFLYRAVLLNPIVDTRYIAHQLTEGRCALRIVPTARKTYAPKVVASVNSGINRVYNSPPLVWSLDEGM